MNQAMKINYTEAEDGMLYPDIQAPNDMKIGKYGRMAAKYLQENHQTRFMELILQDELIPVLQKVDEQCRERLIELTELFMKSNPIPEPMDTMESAQHRNRIQKQVEEIILKELVFIPR